MSKIFCIDQGNTRTKWAIVDGGTLILGSDEKISFPEMLELCEEHKVSGIGVCTVTGQITPESFGHKYPVIYIDGNTRLPILNAYTSSATLGSDRIAMVCGAHSLFPLEPCLAISLGTCITYNVLTENSTFRGGAISPGMHMRYDALQNYTHSLPRAEAREPFGVVGHDTVTSIQSGVYFGIVEELDGMISRYNEAYTNINAILTGGDADFFASQLKNKIFVDPNLVFTGIYAIADFNL